MTQVSNEAFENDDVFLKLMEDQLEEIDEPLLVVSHQALAKLVDLARQSVSRTETATKLAEAEKDAWKRLENEAESLGEALTEDQKSDPALD